ncbi:MAG TPA: sigma-70 family RNA polymerase sigma factor [Gemmataceae bacterium]|jgi:RNA polymerase sigma factor (sigma-70 family)
MPSLPALIRRLRRLPAGAESDAALVRAYVDGDAEAFRELVARHGPLVLGVCRRVLGDVHAAEDAFQATFLVLARRAGSVRWRGTVSAWLFGVARRVALKARTADRRRAWRETRVVPANRSTDPADELTARELLAALDAELDQLPAGYREPLVLCYWQGLTQDEAARRLGCSAGAVKGRIERGRQRLAERLRRRGFAAGDLRPLLVAPVTATAVPADLLARTAALAADPGSRSVPAAVVALAAAAGPSKLLPAVALVTLVAGAGLLILAGASWERERPEKDNPPVAQRPGSAGYPAGSPPNRDDPLPAGAAARFGTARYRHGTRIESLAVSADGRVAVAASGGRILGSTRAYDLATGKAVYQLDGFRSDEAVALSPDGKLLAAMQYDGTVHFLDAAGGQELRAVKRKDDNSRTITNWLTFSPDGKFLAATMDGKTIDLIDVEKAEVVRSFAHPNAVYAAAFSPDGTLLAAGGYDSPKYFIRLWDVATGKEVRKFNGHAGGVRTAAFSPDGATLASGGDDGRLRLWDVATGQERRNVKLADSRRVRSVAFAPDGKTVATAGTSLRLIDPATGTERLKIDQQAIGLRFDADGKALTGAVHGAIVRWDAATGKPLTPDGGDGVVSRVLATPDGRRVVTYDHAGVVHVWDTATGQIVRRIEAGDQHGIALSPDGRLLAYATVAPEVKVKYPEQPNVTGEGGRVRLWEMIADRPLDRFPPFPGQAHDLAFTADGKTLVSVDHTDGTVRLWDMAHGKEARSFRAATGPKRGFGYSVWHSAVSPDGKWLATGHQREDNTTALFGAAKVKLWNVADGSLWRELDGHTNQVDDLAFSPDGKLLATCSQNVHGVGLLGNRTDFVFVWDVATGQRAAGAAEGLGVGAGVVTFSPDGRLLATASADGTIRLWDAATWKELKQFRGHRDFVTALAFTPDGRRLLSGGADTTVLAWDVPGR